MGLRFPVIEHEAAEPCGEDDKQTGGDEDGGVVPCPEYYGDIAAEAYRFDSARHHASGVAAEGGILLPAEICEGDHQCRSNHGWCEVEHEPKDQFVLPQKVERNQLDD